MSHPDYGTDNQISTKSNQSETEYPQGDTNMYLWLCMICLI